MSRLQQLRDDGFEASRHIPFTKQYSVKCESCEALVINGVPCHETGCPNQKFECKGCDERLTYCGYCEQCSS